MRYDKKLASAARTMNVPRWGETTAEQRAAASAAARTLALRRVTKRGAQKSLSAAGKLGAKAYWGSLSPEERRIELRRRAMVRKRNRRERMAKKLEQIVEAPSPLLDHLRKK